MRSRLLSILGALALLCAPTPARADDAAQTGAPAPLSQAPRVPDFLLRQPRAWISINGAMVFPHAGGDLFAFLTDQLTLKKSSFRSASLSFDVGVPVTRVLDVVGGIEGGRRTSGSEYRDYVTSARDPIAQRTGLTTTNMMAGVRYSPLGKGRRLSQFAFVPRRISPFVNGGVTVAYYHLSQLGSFVDFTDLSVFHDQFESNGWGIGPYAGGGVNVQIWRGVFLNVEGRYVWVHSDVNTDFVGFDGIDLSGFRSRSGFTVMF